jgi:hypothetical protein
MKGKTLMDKIELKPCQCSRFAILKEDDEDYLYWIECSSCLMQTEKNRDKNKVIEVWNKRDKEEELERKIEKLETFIKKISEMHEVEMGDSSNVVNSIAEDAKYILESNL